MTTTMLSVPGAKTVRGYSFFGDSFVYVLFDDKTDPYWARSRVVEYLNQVQSRLPPGASASLGPDATGVGWVYEYALVDRSGKQDLSQLRSLNDWFLKFELKTGAGRRRSRQRRRHGAPVPGRPRSRPHACPWHHPGDGHGGPAEGEPVHRRLGRRAGGGRVHGPFARLPAFAGRLPQHPALGDQRDAGPAPRRGERSRSDRNCVAASPSSTARARSPAAWSSCARARTRAPPSRRSRPSSTSLKSSLPPGVEIVSTYDRSQLIDRAVDNLRYKARRGVHRRRAGLRDLSVPSALGAGRHPGVADRRPGRLRRDALARRQRQHHVARRHRHRDRRDGRCGDRHGRERAQAPRAFEARHRQATERAASAGRWSRESAIEVGPALFFSLIVITLSFVPVFTLEAQEGRLFSPLAFTKTYAMAAAAGLSVTLVPVLMGYLIRGRIPQENCEPAQPRADGDLPAGLEAVLRFPKAHPGRRGHRPGADGHSDGAARRRIHAAA